MSALISPYSFAGAPVVPAGIGGNDGATILLLHGDGADNGTLFLDSSIGAGNLHAVTPGGTIVTATSSLVTAKFGTASIKDLGTGADAVNGGYLAIPNTAEFRFGTGEFTIDFWAYQNTFGGNYVIWDMGYATAGALMIQSTTGNPPKYQAYINGVNVLTETNGAALSGWHHHALVRTAGGQLTWYLDGVANGTVANAVAISHSTQGIGVLGGASNTAPDRLNGFTYNGNLDEFRVSTVARWTANFTPPAAPYDTTGVYNFLNPNDKAASVTLTNSNLTMRTSALYGGARAATGKASGKWYWEVNIDVFQDQDDIGWGITAAGTVISGAAAEIGSAANEWGIRKNGSASTQVLKRTGGVDTACTPATTFAVNKKFMSAWDADAGNLWFGYDGTWFNGGNPSTGAVPTFTGVFGTLFPAVEEIRATHGYTMNFGATAFAHTLPTGFSGWTYGMGGLDTFTHLLLHCEGTPGGTTFTDSSQNVFTVTAVGNANTASDQFKFGSTAYKGDGTGDYLSIPDHANLRPGAGDFAVDFWVYFNGSVPATIMLYDKGYANAGGLLIQTAASNKLRVWMNAVQLADSTTAFVANTWTHVAVERVGSAINYYFNGVKDAAAPTSSANLNSTAVLYIGSDVPNAGSLNGWLDEIRFSKCARYGASFVPAQAPYSV